MVIADTKKALSLIAHLLRRAAFGATRDELDEYLARGYDATVEELLNPSAQRRLPDDLIRRYHVDQSELRIYEPGGGNWFFRMVTTTDPLGEKVALMWHRVFATAVSKLTQTKVVMDQVDMFRQYGMGSFRDILLQISKNPAMILWLDNQDNHKGAINENYGRELLELFSMGATNYSEDDIKEASRAFTGWTIANTDYMVLRMQRDAAWPFNRIDWCFEYRPEDHDDGEKTFLGETGNFNGEDIVDIICKQPATARFVARMIYHHFVADELQVPQWPYVAPRDPEAIETLIKAYFESEYNIGHMLRVMFTSDFFKREDVRLARVKSPAEMVAGTYRLVGGFEFPEAEGFKPDGSGPYLGQEVLNPNFSYESAGVSTAMGQYLLSPPSVEGWHGGTDWVNTGAMVERINFASKRFGEMGKPGVRRVVDAVKAAAGNGSLSPESLVDACLEQLCVFDVSDVTRKELADYARKWGNLEFQGPGAEEAEKSVVAMLQLIVTSREYQFA